MKKISRRNFLKIAAGTTAAGALAACGSTNTSTSSTSASTSSSSEAGTTTELTGLATPAGEFPIASEDVTLHFYAASDVAEFNQENYKENVRLGEINEAIGTNVTLDFTFLSNSAEAKTQVTLALAAEDYVDGTMFSPKNAFSRSEIVKYGVNEGYIIPLNDYIEQYGVNIKTILEMRPEYEKAITAPDGNIYALPDFNENGHGRAYPKLWFNTQWLENLGMSMPTTTEELYDVLVAFRDKNPSGNGLYNEIPITGCISSSAALEYYLMNSFIDCPATSTDASPRTFLIMNESGEIDFAANKDAYKDGLYWMNKLYAEGLIDPANFTQDVSSMKQLINQSSEYNTVGAFTADYIGMGLTWGTELSYEYESISPMKGPDGVQYQPYNPFENQLTGFSFAIFDTCENPDVAFRVADYFLNPQRQEVFYGTEGVTYEYYENPTEVNFFGDPLEYEMYSLSGSATQAETDDWYMHFANFLHPTAGLYEYRNACLKEPTEENILANSNVMYEAATVALEDYFPEVSLPRDIFHTTEANTTRFAELLTSINQCVESNTAKFITGARSLDDWDAYVAELDAYGLQEFIALYAESYKALYQ